MSDDPPPGGRGQVTAPEIRVKSPALQTKNGAPPLQNHSKPGSTVPRLHSSPNTFPSFMLLMAVSKFLSRISLSTESEGG